MPNINMRYGTSEKKITGGLPKLIQSGDLEYESTIEDTIFNLDDGGIYWLVTRSTTKATDAYSGHATYQWEVPVGQKFGKM